MEKDDILIIFGIAGAIMLVTLLYAFPPESLVEAMRQSGF